MKLPRTILELWLGLRVYSVKESSIAEIQNAKKLRELACCLPQSLNTPPFNTTADDVMKTQVNTPSNDNVVYLFSDSSHMGFAENNITRICPELDGLEMLYTNDSTPDKLFSLKIVCWGLRENGEVEGMVPWLNKIIPCSEINDPLNGSWEGYRDPGIDDIFYEAPKHKTLELETAAEYYKFVPGADDEIIQEIPDSIGTHAVLATDQSERFMLIEVTSWRLLANGTVQGMLVDESKVETTPVLLGDASLYSAQSHPSFKYFFQHRIANKIKEQDPEALAAISLLMDP